MSMFTFSGKWSSDHYLENPEIKGDAEIKLPYYYMDSFETVLTLTYNAHGDYRAGESHSYELQGTFGKDDNGAKRYLLMPKELALRHSFMLTLVPNPLAEGWAGFFACIHPYDIGRMFLTCEPVCLGCLHDAPGQLAHMEYGGCLAIDD